jgi:hypothetical protein
VIKIAAQDRAGHFVLGDGAELGCLKHEEFLFF